MRLRHRLFALSAAALVVTGLFGCSGNGNPMPPNGPQPQSFSTNNALLRIVNGSPTAGSACNVGGLATTCIDVEVDGKLVASGVPYANNPALAPFSILPYVSVPSGPVLIEIFPTGSHTPVFEPTTPPGPLVLSQQAKYSFVLGGNAPIAPDPFFPGFLFKDGLYQAGFGGSMIDVHNASINAGSLQFGVTCAACPASPGQPIGNPIGAGSINGPISLVPSSNYGFVGKGAVTMTLTAAQLNGLNTSGVIPDPFGKQNISIYAVDTVGAWQLIGIEDTNG